MEGGDEGTGHRHQYATPKMRRRRCRTRTRFGCYRNRGTAPWTASGPYPATSAPNVKLASAAAPPQTPMQQPVPGFPSREELIGRIPGGCPTSSRSRLCGGEPRIQPHGPGDLGSTGGRAGAVQGRPVDAPGRARIQYRRSENPQPVPGRYGERDDREPSRCGGLSVSR